MVHWEFCSPACKVAAQRTRRRGDTTPAAKQGSPPPLTPEQRATLSRDLGEAEQAFNQAQSSYLMPPRGLAQKDLDVVHNAARVRMNEARQKISDLRHVLDHDKEIQSPPRETPITLSGHRALMED